MYFESTFTTKIMKIFTFFGSVEFVILFIFVLLLLSIFKGKLPIFLVFAIAGESFLNYIIKIIIRRERPNILRLVFEDSYSFPSGHTMASVVIFGLLIILVLKSKLNNKLKIIISILLGIIPILVMVSRIYLGVHYFSDVIAGMFLSLSYLLIIIEIYERKKIL